MADFMIYQGVTLPPRFKVPYMDKYNGTGCPRSHLMSVLPLLQQHGLSPEQVALLFPRSLVGTAKKWFLSLKSEEIRTLENIANRFVEQFSMEEGIDVTKRYLKALKQGHNETFTSFIRRWRRKAAQMTHRLSDEEQIKIVIEDALAKGLRSRILSDVREGKRPVMTPKEVHNVNYVKPPPRAITEVRRLPMEQKPPRHFDPLPYSLSVALKKLLKDRKIKLLDIKPLPNPLRRCLALKHQIQNMIDRKELSIELPNVTRNPLPTHAMPPPPSVNVIYTEASVIDPASFICAIQSEGNYVWKFEEEDQWAESEEPYVLSWNDPDVAGPSNQSYILKCEDEKKESESRYVLRLRHVTRGGRVFKPGELRVENPAEVARGVDHQKQKQRLDEEEDNLLNPLKKTQANVSIWGLLMASPKHRQVVLRELNSSQVSIEITPDELVGLVAMTKASKALSFSDEDLPSEGKDYTRPLKITLLCNRKKVFEVLVDNGSAPNVCPLSTATTLGFEPEDFIPTNTRVVKMMRRFGYIPGAGLGKNMQGPTERPELKASNGLFGLGYKPTRKEVQEMKSFMFKWAECRRRGLEFPMGPFSKVMNGRFRKEGADFPYYGFSEPWYDENGTKLPGLEIFFTDELPADFYNKQIAVTAVAEEPGSDWVKNLESEFLDSLFQVEAPVIAMIGRDAPFVNPKNCITPAEGPRPHKLYPK
ncbi:uncharacterized protein LOC143863313 [Tasmannia lanceolata]|uniref:uncharacterized protein LOC143863313 n=1 Tax=Tasmannia lanceolata TaxID=3420 RepID=UPI0040649F9D